MLCLFFTAHFEFTMFTWRAAHMKTQNWNSKADGVESTKACRLFGGAVKFIKLNWLGKIRKWIEVQSKGQFTSSPGFYIISVFDLSPSSLCVQ